MAEPKSQPPKADSASAEVQKQVDEAEDKGFIGVETDPTPNERYSQESDDWRTPETDPEMAAKAAGPGKFGSAAKEGEAK